MKKEGPIVIAVTHSTHLLSNRGQLKITNNSSKTIRLLRRIGEQEVGFEFRETVGRLPRVKGIEDIPWLTSQRYAKSTYRRARRIKLEGGSQKAINISLLDGGYYQSRLTRFAFLFNEFLFSHEGRANPANEHIHENFGKFVESAKARKYVHKTDFAAIQQIKDLILNYCETHHSDLGDIYDALSYQRSLEMLQEAKRRKLGVIVVGASHGSDLKRLGYRTYYAVNTDAKKHGNKLLDVMRINRGARWRASNYRAHLPLIRQMVLAAKS
ncbi:MAG: hypothetical protein ABH863_02175 [Candidatus Micrarchaeota archaeon]